MKTDKATFVNSVIHVPDPKKTPPARPTSARFKRWKILLGMDGSTVSDYYAKCKEAGIPCTRNNPELAVQKGLVTLEPPKEEAKKETTTEAKKDKPATAKKEAPARAANVKGRAT